MYIMRRKVAFSSFELTKAPLMLIEGLYIEVQEFSAESWHGSFPNYFWIVEKLFTLIFKGFTGLQSKRKKKLIPNEYWSPLVCPKLIYNICYLEIFA